jgi:hypothetical protein
MTGAILAMTDDAHEPLMTREQAAEYLTELGYPTTKNLLDKLQARRLGPPIEKLWGKRVLYLPSAVRAWAEKRARTPGDVAA